MKGLAIVFKWIFSKLPLIKYIFTPFMAWGILIISIILTINEKGIKLGFIDLIQKVFSAEYTIYENVNIAVNNPTSFGFFGVLQILSGIFIIYYLVKWITKIFVGISGSQAWMGAVFLAYLVIYVLQIATTIAIYKDLMFWNYFIPFWDSFIYLFMNLNYVLDGIPILKWFIENNPDPISEFNSSNLNITSV